MSSIPTLELSYTSRSSSRTAGSSDWSNSNHGHSPGFAKRHSDPLLEEIDAATLSGSIERSNKLTRRSSAIEEAGLTINKLRFERHDCEHCLFGRDAEIKMLLDVLHRCKTVKGSRELVSIGGLSGTGKSALASCLRGPVQRANAVFVSGKCAQGAEEDPYSGIASACQDLCWQLLQRPGLCEIRDKIMEQVGTETLELLTDMVPVLAHIIHMDEEQEEQHEDEEQQDGLLDVSVTSGNSVVEQAKHQFRYAFCRFFQCVTASFPGATLVMVLNDVHDIDTASLDLIQALLQDQENPHSLMIVTTYRTNEVENQERNHRYANLLVQLRSRTSVGITGIQLGNLGRDHVNQMLQSVLSVDDASDLAELCMQRTMGNAHFLRRFMVLLEEEQLLQFNYGQLDWKWDCNEIEEKTAVTANVVDLLTVKMTSLDPGLQRLLSLASFLGPTFDWNTINIIWNALPLEEHVASNSVEKWVYLAMQETFLEKDGQSSYRWSHDKVKEAASSLVPTEDAATTQFELGEILYRSYNRHQLNEAIFLVSNLMNAVEVERLAPDQQTRNAKLNLMAAIKAKGLSAFESAASYVAKGLNAIHTMPEQWPPGSFQLLLDLHSVGAQAELAVGRSEQATIYCDKVLKQKTATILDKRRVHSVMLQSMGAGGRPAEAVQLALKVLKDLGCKFPTNTTFQALSAISSFLKVTSKRNLPKTEDIKNLPLMKDPAKIECMKIMDMASAFTYATGQSFVFLLFMGRMVDWSLKYGLSDRTPAAFGNVGFLASHVKGNHDLGVQWGDHSMLALQRVESKICESRCFMARAWSSPFKSTLQPLLQGYKSGMMAGDAMNAVLCLWHVIHHALLSGKVLRKVEEDCRRYSGQMKSLKQQHVAETTNMTWQAILNLMGRSHKTTTKLQGEAMDEKDFLSQGEEEVAFCIDHFQAIKSILFCYFAEHKAGAELAVQKGSSYQKKNPGGPIGSVDCFCRAVSLYDAARTHKGGKRRLYKKHAAAARSTLAAIARNGNPNVTHLGKFLDAEHAALSSKKRRKAVKLYEEAITLAARGGFLQDVALANERLSDYLMLQVSSSKSTGKIDEGDREEARFRLEKAIEYYEDWGAFGKAELLQPKLEAIVKQLPSRRDSEVWR